MADMKNAKRDVEKKVADDEKDSKKAFSEKGVQDEQKLKPNEIVAKYGDHRRRLWRSRIFKEEEEHKFGIPEEEVVKAMGNLDFSDEYVGVYLCKILHMDTELSPTMRNAIDDSFRAMAKHAKETGMEPNQLFYAYIRNCLDNRRQDDGWVTVPRLDGLHLLEVSEKEALEAIPNLDMSDPELKGALILVSNDRYFPDEVRCLASDALKKI